ncbi:hypothetical protein [Mesorhizobium sp. Cs1321R2N1]|uniref:hypothetical protein n=1 Tax=Mesorhizobium sp. Cs1321R2N1 TaxID=3015174 RepID=UPI00301D97EE
MATFDEIENGRPGVTARLAAAPSDVPDLHPNIATLYRKRVVQLTQALADHDDARPAAEELRLFIGEIVLTPASSAARCMPSCAASCSASSNSPKLTKKSDDVMTKRVAGPRNEFYHKSITVPV